jgi:hypothetical protein
VPICVSGTKARTSIFCGGSKLDDHRMPRVDPFALAIERVEDQAGLRRGLKLLREVPLRLGEALAVLVARRPRKLKIPHRRRAGSEAELLLPLKILLGKGQRGLRLIERRFFHRPIEFEKRIARLDLGAPVDIQGLQRPGQRR